MDNKNSLLYWFPKISRINGILLPKTEILQIPHDTFQKWSYGQASIEKYVPRIKEAAKKVGYPLFLRTDLASGKHDWKNACYVPSEKELVPHLFRVIEFNEMEGIIGLPYKALVFREFLDLEWRFKAFWGEMPIARERRYFVKDGKVICHHPYWPEDAIKNPSVENWRTLLKTLNMETKEEVSILTLLSRRVAEVLDGYWSIDYAYTKEGKWYLIDTALGKDSWHPKCPFREVKSSVGEERK